MNEKRDLPYSVQEKGINLIDMVWEIIYSWRMLIVFGVLCACLLSGLKYSLDNRNREVSEDSTVGNIRTELSESENLKLEKAIIENESIEKQLKSNMEYQRDSILMNLDPYHENQFVLQYYIDSHYKFNLNENISKDYTQSLLRTYKTYVTNNEITQACAEKLGIEDDRYLAELISAEPDLQSEEKDLGDSTFSVSIAGKDMEQAKMIADVVRNALERYQSELSDKIGAHELVLINSYEQSIQNTALAEQQAKVESTIYNLKIQQESLKSKLSAQQLQILEAQQEETKDTLIESNTESPTEKVRISKKYMILGFLIGVFLICVIIAFRYIFSIYLKNEKELLDIYGLRIFGAIDTRTPSKKIFSFVDRGLDRISGRQQGVLNDQMEITTANLLVACKKFQKEKLFFTSSVHIDGEEKSLIAQMIGQLKKEGIEAVFEENMMQNIKALIQMSETGQVVLVEKMKQTKYQALEEELRLCKEQAAEIVGVVAIR